MAGFALQVAAKVVGLFLILLAIVVWFRYDYFSPGPLAWAPEHFVHLAVVAALAGIGWCLLTLGRTQKPPR